MAIANVGSRWTNGGNLEFFNKETGTVIVSFDASTDSITINGFGAAANQADSVAATVADAVIDFNLLLDKLKASGLMVADA